MLTKKGQGHILNGLESTMLSEQRNMWPFKYTENNFYNLRSQPHLHGIRYRFQRCQYFWIVCPSPKTVPRRRRPFETYLKAVPTLQSCAILLPCSRIEHNYPLFIFWRSSVVPIRILQEYWSSHNVFEDVNGLSHCACWHISKAPQLLSFKEQIARAGMLWRSWFRLTCRLVLYSYACYFEEYTGQWQNLWRTLCSAVWKSRWKSKLRGIVFSILT